MRHFSFSHRTSRSKSAISTWARLDYQRFLDVGDEEETIETDIDLISLSVQFR